MTDPSGRPAMEVFDRRAVRRNRARAAAMSDGEGFLFREVADRLADRLDEVRRSFSRVLVLGDQGGYLRRSVLSRDDMELCVACDPAPRVAALSDRWRALCAEEDALPFADAGFDLVLGGMSLHWVNDLPGALVQIRRALRPDGLFLAALAGGDTLGELRRALIEAEMATTGGAGPRVAPFAELRDAGDLLQRAGFALPMADADGITVTYADAFALMRDLRAMGEGNVMTGRRKSFSRRDTLFTAAARYTELYAGSDGRIPATFDILMLTGWAPHVSQQKPARRGSAHARLADALDADAHGTGDPVPPPAGPDPA